MESKDTKNAPTMVNSTREFFVELLISVIAPINGAVNNTNALQIANAHVL